MQLEVITLHELLNHIGCLYLQLRDIPLTYKACLKQLEWTNGDYWSYKYKPTLGKIIENARIPYANPLSNVTLYQNNLQLNSWD